MMGIARGGWAVGILVTGLLVAGCAQGEGGDEGAPAPSNAAAPAKTSAAAPQTAEVRAPEPELSLAPLGDHVAMAGGAVELRPATTWTRSAKDGFEVLASPDGKARILIAPFSAGDKVVQRRDAALSALGASDVRTSEERTIRVGEGQLEAQANDGSCVLPSGEAGFQYAVIDAGRGKKTFLLYMFDKDAPESTRASGMKVIASMRGKS